MTTRRGRRQGQDASQPHTAIRACLTPTTTTFEAHFCRQSCFRQHHLLKIKRDEIEGYIHVLLHHLQEEHDRLLVHLACLGSRLGTEGRRLKMNPEEHQRQEVKWTWIMAL